MMEETKTTDQNPETNTPEENTQATDNNQAEVKKEEAKVEEPVLEETTAEAAVQTEVKSEVSATAEDVALEAVETEEKKDETDVVVEQLKEKEAEEEKVEEEKAEDEKAEEVTAEETEAVEEPLDAKETEAVEESVEEKETESVEAKEAEAVEESVEEKETEAVEEVVEEVVEAKEAEVIEESTEEKEAEAVEEVVEAKETEVIEESVEEKEAEAVVEATEEEAEVDVEEVEESFEEFSAEELISRLEELVQSDDVSLIKTKVALIKVAFMRIAKEEQKLVLDKFVEEGGKKEEFKREESKFERRFNKAFEVYRRNKIKFNELQEKKKIVNLAKKQEILDHLKVLISSEETLKKTYDKFRTLQTEWKEVGMVPSGEVSNLWQSYHFLVEKFFDKVKINKELRDLDMKKNLELKLELCEKTEELLLETSVIRSFKQLQKYHDEWKEIGAVPQEQSDELWERFKAATDKINERRREHYGQLQDEQDKNLLAKTDLCEKAEELLTVSPDGIKSWQEQTNKMSELFNVWKSIGRAPKNENTAIWERFKGSMNTFYNNKKEFLKTIKNEQLNNYNLKVDLCVEAESLKDSSEWKNTTQELIRLQKEWKKIGPVPRKHSDKIWKRFRAACDEFFNKKSDHFSSVHDNEKVNLDKKKELIEKVKEQKFDGDKSKNLDILKGFQREWMAIGYVPMKDKENVQKQFREAIDSRLEELKISSTELSNASYATRMEAVKDSPDASRVYRKEIIFLSNKINKLRDDINLWENNLGFFANSKKADVLKQEFEQKIEKARQELAGMEAKVKYLRKMDAEF